MEDTAETAAEAPASDPHEQLNRWIVVAADEPSLLGKIKFDQDKCFRKIAKLNQIFARAAVPMKVTSHRGLPCI